MVSDQFSSVHFSRSVTSDSLRSHESQHTRPPCPSPAQSSLWYRQGYMFVNLFVFLLSTQEDCTSQSSVHVYWDHVIEFYSMWTEILFMTPKPPLKPLARSSMLFPPLLLQLWCSRVEDSRIKTWKEPRSLSHFLEQRFPLIFQAITLNSAESKQ